MFKVNKSGRINFVIGFALGAALFGGTVAYAAGIMAQPKTAAVVIDGRAVDLQGYIIEGSHYFQLRDLDAALIPGGKDFSIVWDGGGNRVIIDTSRRYDPAEQYIPAALEPSAAPVVSPPAETAPAVKLQMTEAELEAAEAEVDIALKSALYLAKRNIDVAPARWMQFRMASTLGM